jgi:hypothetical protein
MKSKSDPFDLFSCAGLDRDNIRQLALETGFCKRASGRISAPDFFIHLCLQSVAGTVSYNDLAARVEAHTGVAASLLVLKSSNSPGNLTRSREPLCHIGLDFDACGSNYLD